MVMIAKLSSAVTTTVLVLGLAGNASAAELKTQYIPVHQDHTASAASLKCSPVKHHKLVWYGGPVGAPGIVLVYWGSWWRTHGGAVKTELANLYGGVAASKWAATLKQYCDSSGPPQLPGGGFPFPDYTNPPKAPSNAQINAEVNKISTFIEGEPPIFVVVTPPGIAPAYDTKNGLCGQHGWTLRKGGGPDLSWIDIPYGIIAKTHGCGWALKQGVPGAVSVVAGHEWAEAVTDPFVNSNKPGSGWATSGKNAVEVADLCEPELILHIFHSRVFVLKLKTGEFVMQELWSNAAGKCVTGS
jgi:hypothetical protein